MLVATMFILSDTSAKCIPANGTRRWRSSTRNRSRPSHALNVIKRWGLCSVFYDVAVGYYSVLDNNTMIVCCFLCHDVNNPIWSSPNVKLGITIRFKHLQFVITAQKTCMSSHVSGVVPALTELVCNDTCYWTYSLHAASKPQSGRRSDY